MLGGTDRKIGARARTHCGHDLAAKRVFLLLAVLDCRSIGFDVPTAPEQFYRQRRHSCPNDMGSWRSRIFPEGGLGR